ncbi:MAG: UDP-N-acetylmuramate--L-alanine ligase [Clostridia bacterium]|nr:UDP-N-acetylmuramate--L-alanine ligase [Clostridia bacterium]
MNKNFNVQSFNKIHFIGIGGISQSALAKYCLSRGTSVSGSDARLSEITKELKSLGIKVYLGHHGLSVIGKDLVVYSSAVSENCPELVTARERGIPIISRAEFLGEILKAYKTKIAVSGSHGKTTTTAMLGEIFVKAKLNPTIFLGGEYFSYGNFRKGGKKYAITEACEYKKNFLMLPHDSSIVLNVDNDHLDSYLNMDDMINCFNKFLGDGLALVNADDQNASKLFNRAVATFGIKKTATFNAKNLRLEKNGYSFDFYAYQKKIGRIKLSVLGKHNVINALASAGLAYLYGVKFLVIKKALFEFKGVKRRNEFIGQLSDAKVYADYAHHPTEIKSTLETFRHNKKTLVVFQPHTYSRTKNLMQDFIDVFSKVENLIIYKTYSAREKFDDNGSAYKLNENLRLVNVNSIYADDFCQLQQQIIAKLEDKIDKILVLGAGDVYEDVKKIILNYNTNKKNTKSVK